MEFKAVRLYAIYACLTRINRNIMEFKADIDISQAIEETGINRNIMEFKGLIVGCITMIGAGN